MNTEGTDVLFKKLLLIISSAHMRTCARARVYIDTFRFSFQKMANRKKTVAIAKSKYVWGNGKMWEWKEMEMEENGKRER